MTTGIKSNINIKKKVISTSCPLLCLDVNSSPAIALNKIINTAANIYCNVLPISIELSLEINSFSEDPDKIKRNTIGGIVKKDIFLIILFGVTSIKRGKNMADAL